MTSKYKYLLFDADNTLLDFTKSSEVAFKKMINTYVDGDPDVLFKVYYRINKECWERVELGTLSLAEVKTKRFELYAAELGVEINPKEINEHYFSILKETIFFVDGAIELLNALKQKGVGMSIITNGLKEVQERRFELADINHFFDAIIISDAIGTKKPDTAFFDYTFQKVPSFDKGDYLVIGDTPGSDILGAERSGLPSCWFNPKGLIWKEKEYTPKHEIRTLSEVLKLV